MTAIAVGSGLATQLVVKDEATYGVAPALTSGIDSFEILNETLELKKTTVMGEGLAGGRVYERGRRRVLTNYDYAGDIKMNAPTRNLGWWLRYMISDFTQTPAQLGVSGIYQTIFQPRSSYFGHSFSVQKGIPAVDATVEPFTGVGCKIASWELSVATGGIADLTLTVDGRNELGGAGNSDPLNGSVPPLAAFATPTSGLGLSVFHFRQATLFQGTPTLAATTVVAPGGTPGFPLTTVPVFNTTGGTVMVTIVGGTLTSVLVNGVQVGTVAGTYPVQPGQSIAIVYSAAPTWTWFTGKLSLASSTAVGNVKNCSMKQAVSFDTNRIFIGSSGFKSEQIENGYRKITGSATIEWQSSEAIYNAYAGDTTSNLELTFVGPTVSGQTYLLDIIVPYLKFEGETPKAPGPSVITQAANFSGFDDEATVPIQVIYQSEDISF